MANTVEPTPILLCSEEPASHPLDPVDSNIMVPYLWFEWRISALSALSSALPKLFTILKELVLLLKELLSSPTRHCDISFYSCCLEGFNSMQRIQRISSGIRLGQWIEFTRLKTSGVTATVGIIFQFCRKTPGQSTHLEAVLKYLQDRSLRDLGSRSPVAYHVSSTKNPPCHLVTAQAQVIQK